MPTDPSHPAPPIRSITAAELVLPAVGLAPPVAVRLAAPMPLRLPLAAPVAKPHRLPLLDVAPAVRSYRFGAPAAAQPAPGRVAAPAAGDAGPAPAGGRRTRIAPPGDVVKLEERFFYLLQPDLETILSSARLAFPREPFPFQLDGIAYLVPRHAAVLADEMGLGKSMQAISSLRLLVRSGEARSVLVVCPKGLVSNWARELADWAPELTVAVIEGEPDRRRWQWTLPDVPVKLANYEVLVRDRDLVGIFEFVAPGHVNERMTPRALGAAVADHVLRRTKDKVLTDMPPRLNRDCRIELGAAQRETYRRAEEDGVLRLSDMGGEATIRHVFELVLRLKQICNFDTATGESAKLERLAAELEEVQASGRKALVFSQWVQTLGRLRRGLERFGALEYHGGMPTAARDETIRRFRSDPRHSVLLLSYGAGAVGLNLQFSQYVFLFDRWWNPAIEDQAVNRAHRIGAAGAVTVTRFLAAGTIEERIDEVLRRKRDLSEMILSQAGEPVASGLTVGELFALFDLPAPTGVGGDAPARLAA